MERRHNPRAHDFVFPRSTGDALDRHAVRRRVVVRAAERANQRIAERGACDPLPCGVSPHSLRRSFATWLLSETLDVALVQAELGHVDPSMTLSLYANAIKRDRRVHARRHAVDAVQDLDGQTPPAEPIAATA